MTREQFVTGELKRFDEANSQPFRVAVSNNLNGSDYPYGSHTEPREYADTTIGWCHDQVSAAIYLGEAWDKAKQRNEEATR